MVPLLYAATICCHKMLREPDEEKLPKGIISKRIYTIYSISVLFLPIEIRMLLYFFQML